MRRVPKVLLWVAGLVVVAVIALVSVALTINPDAYRPLVESELTEAFGSKVSIERLSFGWSLRPTLVVQNLRIANPAWASRPYLATVRQGAARIDLIALWRGSVQIGSLVLEGADLLLETTRDGKQNWATETAAPSASNQPATQLPDFAEIALTDSEVGWRAADGAFTRGHLDQANAVLTPDRPFVLNARGSFRDTPLVVKLEANTSLQKALAGTPVTASVALQAPETRADLDITLPKPFGLDGIVLKLNGEGKRLDTLSALLTQTLPAWGPYQIAAHAAFTSDSVRLTELRIAIAGLPGPAERVEIQSGEAQLSSSAPTEVRVAGRLDETDFALDATTASFPTLAEASGQIPLTAKLTLGGFELGVDGKVDPWEGLGPSDLSVTTKGDVRSVASLLGTEPFRQAFPVELAARIEADAQEIRANGLRGTVAGCTVAGDLTLERAPRPKLNGALDLGRLDVTKFEHSSTAPASAPPTAATQGMPTWLTALDANLRLKIQGIAGLPLPAEALSAQASLVDATITLQGFRGSLAGTVLAGNAQLEWKGGRPYLDATLRVPTLDLSKLAPVGSDSKTTFAPDTALPLAPLRAIDADLQVEIDRVAGAPMSVDGLRGSARLMRGRLTVSPLQIRLAGVATQSAFTVDATTDDASLNARIAAASIDLPQLLRAFNSQASVQGALGPSELTVVTHGATPRTWLAQAQVQLQAGASTIRLEADREEVRIDQASATAAPGAPVQVQLRGSAQAVPFSLSATGGALTELLDGDRAWPTISAELRATVREHAVRLTALTGPLKRVAAGRDVPIRIEASTDGARAVLTGTIADLREPERSPLHVAITAPSLAHLPLSLGDVPMPDIPLTLSGVVAVAPNSVSIAGLTARAGDTDLTGSARIEHGSRLKVTADLTAGVLDLNPWLPHGTSKPTQGERVSILGWSLSVDRPIPVDTLRSIDLALRVNARRLLKSPLQLEDYTLDARLDAGLLDVSQAASQGNMQLHIRLDARTAVPAAAVRFSIRDLDLEEIKTTGERGSGANLPRISVTTELAGFGTATREIYASAQGEILLTAGPGRIRAVASPFAIQGLFVDLLSVLTPGRKPDNYSELECAASRFDIAKGIATSPDGIALRFKRMDLLGSGAINLSTGEILFGFKAVRRQLFSFSPIGLASGFAEISGTLNSPKVGLNPEGVLVQGTAAWATLGISLLASDFLRKLQATQDPCAEIVAKGHTAGDPLDALIRALPLPGVNTIGQPSAPSRPAQ